MTARDLFQQLHDARVVLTPWPDGTLRYKAPAGVMEPGMLAAIRQHKAALLDLVETFEERAAMAEYGGGLPRVDAERQAWESLVGERR